MQLGHTLTFAIFCSSPCFKKTVDMNQPRGGRNHGVLAMTTSPASGAL